jgi:hypothetical protein
LQMEIQRNWKVRRVSTTVAQMNWARFLKDDPCPDCHSSHTDDTSHIVKTDQFPMNLYICSPSYTHDRKRRCFCCIWRHLYYATVAAYFILSYGIDISHFF